jgi:uncharacterized membrane protein
MSDVVGILLGIFVCLLFGVGCYAIGKKQGHNKKLLWVYFFIGFFLQFWGLLVVAVITSIKSKSMNKQSYSISNDESNNLDKLKKYKKLLDMGAITQEEFDKKKSEIM